MLLIRFGYTAVSLCHYFSKMSTGNGCSMTLLSSVNVRHITMYIANKVSVPGVFMTSSRYVGDREQPLDPKQSLGFPFRALTESACV